MSVAPTETVFDKLDSNDSLDNYERFEGMAAHAHKLEALVNELREQLKTAESIKNRMRETLEKCANPKGGALAMAPENIVAHVEGLRALCATPETDANSILGRDGPFHAETEYVTADYARRHEIASRAIPEMLVWLRTIASSAKKAHQSARNGAVRCDLSNIEGLAKLAIDRATNGGAK